MKLSFVVALLVAGAMASPAPMTAAPLEKRYKEKIVNNEYKKLQEEKNKVAEGEDPDATTTTLKPWHRTIYDDQVELVRPTVIAGVTFSTKPPETTNGLEPWISLNKDGLPKTIKPKMKNGHIKNASPTYDTWFATPTTVVYTKEQLKAHNMADDEVYEHVEYIPEDQTYHQLNPILRCTPDFYGNKGMAKDTKSEPFCFPRDNAMLKVDHTYFVTWYSRFFDEDVTQVKVHLSYIKEKAIHKGFKRDLLGARDAVSAYLTKRHHKRLAVLEKGGKVSQASFFTSEWLSNDAGFYPLTIEDEWLGKEYNRKVLVSIQPDTVADEDFDLLEKSIVIDISRGAKVAKGHNEDLKKLEDKWRQQALNGEYEIEEGIDYEKYMVILGMPTCVAIAALCMYFFVFINRKSTDLSHLKKKRFAGKNTTHRMISLKKKNKDYKPLPQYSLDVKND